MMGELFCVLATLAVTALPTAVVVVVALGALAPYLRRRLGAHDVREAPDGEPLGDLVVRVVEDRVGGAVVRTASVRGVPQALGFELRTTGRGVRTGDARVDGAFALWESEAATAGLSAEARDALAAAAGVARSARCDRGRLVVAVDAEHDPVGIAVAIARLLQRDLDGTGALLDNLASSEPRVARQALRAVIAERGDLLPEALEVVRAHPSPAVRIVAGLETVDVAAVQEGALDPATDAEDLTTALRVLPRSARPQVAAAIVARWEVHALGLVHELREIEVLTAALELWVPDLGAARRLAAVLDALVTARESDAGFPLVKWPRALVGAIERFGEADPALEAP